MRLAIFILLAMGCKPQQQSDLKKSGKDNNRAIAQEENSCKINDDINGDCFDFVRYGQKKDPMQVELLKNQFVKYVRSMFTTASYEYWMKRSHRSVQFNIFPQILRDNASHEMSRFVSVTYPTGIKGTQRLKSRPIKHGINTAPGKLTFTIWNSESVSNTRSGHSYSISVLTLCPSKWKPLGIKTYITIKSKNRSIPEMFPSFKTLETYAQYSESGDGLDGFLNRYSKKYGVPKENILYSSSKKLGGVHFPEGVVSSGPPTDQDIKNALVSGCERAGGLIKEATVNRPQR